MTVEMSVLPNGVRVVTEGLPRVESVALGVWVEAGARCETAATQGLAHMLEHMAFKGTARRSARAIAEEIEAVGGYLNAYTAREQTAYYARVLKADMGLAVDILADILRHSQFERTELAREQQVVLQEIGEAKDTPDDIIFDHLQAVAFPDQPMGRPILGTEASVRGFRPATLRAYLQRWYVPDALLAVAVGAVDHRRFRELVAAGFADLPRKPSPQPKPARYRGGEFREIDRLEQAHLTLGLEGVSLTDPEHVTAQVFTTVLGGGMSSRLFQEVREKRGLAYAIYAFGHSFRDDGLIGVYAGTGAGQLRELVPIVVGEIEAIAAGATEMEVARARAQLRAGLLMAFESPFERAEQIAGQISAFGRARTVKEMLSELAAVDAARVRAFAARLMRERAPSVAALGPVKALEPYARLKARFG